VTEKDCTAGSTVIMIINKTVPGDLNMHKKAEEAASMEG
jgi:hypothetical protein